MSMIAGRTTDKDSNIIWFVGQCMTNTNDAALEGRVPEANPNAGIDPGASLRDPAGDAPGLRIARPPATRSIAAAAVRNSVDPRTAWFARECERNGVRIETCVRSAERVGDSGMAAFFRRAQREAHRITSGAGR